MFRFFGRRLFPPVTMPFILYRQGATVFDYLDYDIRRTVHGREIPPDKASDVGNFLITVVPGVLARNVSLFQQGIDAFLRSVNKDYAALFALFETNPDLYNLVNKFKNIILFKSFYQEYFPNYTYSIQQQVVRALSSGTPMF